VICCTPLINWFNWSIRLLFWRRKSISTNWSIGPPLINGKWRTANTALVYVFRALVSPSASPVAALTVAKKLSVEPVSPSTDWLLETDHCHETVVCFKWSGTSQIIGIIRTAIQTLLDFMLALTDIIVLGQRRALTVVYALLQYLWRLVALVHLYFLYIGTWSPMIAVLQLIIYTHLSKMSILMPNLLSPVSRYYMPKSPPPEPSGLEC